MYGGSQQWLPSLVFAFIHSFMLDDIYSKVTCMSTMEYSLHTLRDPLQHSLHSLYLYNDNLSLLALERRLCLDMLKLSRYASFISHWALERREHTAWKTQSECRHSCSHGTSGLSSTLIDIQGSYCIRCEASSIVQE